jgi:MFS family permease
MTARVRGTAGATVQAVSVSVIGVLPTYLVGALVVQIRADLGVTLGMFGLLVATSFMLSGLLSRPGGRVVQRLGSRKGAVLAATLAVVALVGVALARSPAWLAVGMALGGVANAVAQPSANLGISQLVTDRRLGVAFGIKQSSVPVATLLGGLAVPGIALVLGWRWAVVAGAVVALLVLVTAAASRRDTRGRGQPDVERPPDKGVPRGALLVLTVGGFLASAAVAPTGVFLVDAAVAAGLTPGTAGLLFAICSVFGICSRVGFGWLADRHPDRSRYVFIANLLAGGALGYAALATGWLPFFVAGSFVAYCFGWAWPGLFHFAVIRDNRAAAASVTGFVQTGLSLGAGTGPLAFGVIAQVFSYTAAWLTTAGLCLAAAAMMRTGRRMIRRSRGLPVAGLRRRPSAETSVPSVQMPT